MSFSSLLQVSKWIKTADVPHLEHAVYMGRASYMAGRAAWNDDVRGFLQTVPNIAASIDEFHSAVEAGDAGAVNKHLASDRRLISSRDQHGRTALHKAAQLGSTAIVETLLNGDLTLAEALARAADKVNDT